MTHTKKPSPFFGKQANHFSRSGATLQKCVRRFALAKVSAELTKGASVSRHIKEFLTEQYKYLPVILERSEESRQRIQDLNTLTCVRKHAPIAAHSSALPSEFGES